MDTKLSFYCGELIGRLLSLSTGNEIKGGTKGLSG